MSVLTNGPTPQNSGTHLPGHTRVQGGDPHEMAVDRNPTMSEREGKVQARNSTTISDVDPP